MKASIAILLLLIAPMSRGQQLPELLRPVDAYKAGRLIEYNSSSFQAEIYSAKRFRIVIPEVSLLLKDEDFTFTPFDDVAPIHLTRENVLRWEDSVAWNARMDIDVPREVRAAGLRPTVLLSMMAWDTDKLGNAISSSEARQKQLETVKHAFYSVRAELELAPDRRYMLVPLKYTPKYAVIYEIDPEKQVLFMTERPAPGDEFKRTPAEAARVADYENFKRNLAPEENYPVVEDVQ